jgi:MFS family permease
MAHPLRDRNFRLLFTGRVVDELGDAVSPAALTLAIVIATRSSAGLALVLACALLPKVALLPIGGVVADRLGPRRVALAAAVVSGAAQLCIGLLLLAGHIDFPLIAAASAVKGAASAFDTAGGQRPDGHRGERDEPGRAGAGRLADLHRGHGLGVRT